MLFIGALFHLAGDKIAKYDSWSEGMISFDLQLEIPDDVTFVFLDQQDLYVSATPRYFMMILLSFQKTSDLYPQGVRR